MVKHIEKATQLGQHAFSFFGRQCSRRLAVRRETNFASALLLFPRLSACQLLTIRSSSARGMLRAHRERGAARARARGERARQPHAVSFCFFSTAFVKNENDLSSKPFAHFSLSKETKTSNLFVELLHDAPLFRRFEARFGKSRACSTERGAERGQRNVSEGRSRGHFEESSPSKRRGRRSKTISQKNQVLRVSAFSVGLVYGSWKLSSLKSTAAKAAAEKEKAASHGGGH